MAQANLTVPSLPNGDYPLTITIGGVASNAPLITVGGAGGSAATLTPLGSLSLSGINHSSNVVPNGNTVYVCGPQAISVVDVSNPSSPTLLSAFGQSDLNGNGLNCTMFGNNLLELVNTQTLVVYNIANPVQPQPASGAVSPPFPFAGNAFFAEIRAF